MNIENAGVETNDVGTDIEQELNTESGAPQVQKDDTDWEAEYKKAVEERDNYKTALTQKRQLRTKAPETKEDDEEDDSKPLTRGDIRKIISEEVLPVVSGSKVDTILEQKIKDPQKRQYVKFIYENRISQTGTSDEAIQNDLNDALDLADSKVNKKKASETARLLDKKTTLPMNGSESDTTVNEQKNHKFSAEQVKALTEKALAQSADPQKFIEAAWKNMGGK